VPLGYPGESTPEVGLGQGTLANVPCGVGRGGGASGANPVGGGGGGGGGTSGANLLNPPRV
jgi:hypothetical protein